VFLKIIVMYDKIYSGKLMNNLKGKIKKEKYENKY